MITSQHPSIQEWQGLDNGAIGKELCHASEGSSLQIGREDDDANAIDRREGLLDLRK